MMLAKSPSGPISRQTSVCQLAAEKQKKKAARSKRCKSLLMLSSPFSDSVKSSLLSLWQPNAGATNTQILGHHFKSTDRLEFEGRLGADQKESPATEQASPSAKCVKMKLFEQPLEKLISPKAMKQLNLAINSFDSSAPDSPNRHQQQQHFLTKRKRTSSSYAASASLRKFTATNLADASDANNNSLTTTTSSKGSPPLPTKGERRRLLLACLPQPIRNLLNELYLRGPSTIGIFRKSPSAKHCKELKQKLETDSQSSIEQFQVTVIASVFKEWLRSLPDCLLMSRLYPQWIDVAKLMEPLHQQLHQPLLQQHQSRSLDDSSCSDSPMDATSSLRPSPLTDSAANSPGHSLPLDRAHSCSTMIMPEFHSINKMTRCTSSLLDAESISGSPTATSGQQQRQQQQTNSNGGGQPPLTMSEFALAERHSECLRIVCQLLEALNEANLILLRSFICVLWNIANNSDFNKMSANNLGVCVGQSLLNDEHQFSGKSGASQVTGTFSKRHRRSRSQCLLSSTLSLTNATLLQSGCYLDSSGAQETAKYVPILVAFMIENAPALFGQDVTEMLASDEQKQEEVKESRRQSLAVIVNANMDNKQQQADPDRLTNTDSKMVITHGDDKENTNCLREVDSFDHIDSGANSSMDDSPSEREINPLRQQILVESLYKSEGASKQQHNSREPEGRDINSNTSDSTAIPTANKLINQQQQVDHDEDSATTSILIVNPPKSRQSDSGQQQERPLSATESTSSSSRASSSTSGVHSQSPAFSNETDSHNTRTTTCSNSPAPSSVSSPSSMSVSASTSPLQERHGDEDEDESQQRANSRLSPATRPHEQLPDSSVLTAIVHSTDQKGDSRRLAKGSAPTIHQLGRSISAAFADSSPAVRCHQQQQYREQEPVPHNRHMLLHRYSTFMGVLNRVPKIPVQFTTSNYGGEAVIYNPRPERQVARAGVASTAPNASDATTSGPTSITTTTTTTASTTTSQLEDFSPKPNDSVISVKPLNAPQVQQQQYHTMASLSQQELRQQRINEFLAHRHQLKPLVSTPSLPYLAPATHDYASAAVRQHQHGMIAHQQAAFISRQQQASSAHYGAPNMQQQVNQQQYQQISHAHQQLQHQIFYSTTNLNSLQQQQQQLQDRYQLYHRASLNPQRSHVMSLRNYYLSLQQNQQQQHQPSYHNSYRNTIHSIPSQDQMLAQQSLLSNNKLNQSSQHPLQHRFAGSQQQFVIEGHQQQSTRQMHHQSQQGAGKLMTHHQAIQRPQPRLAKIRQNQFNGIYVKSNQQPQQSKLMNLGQGGQVKPVSSTSSDDHLSDESDEYSSEWAESTMV